MINAIAAFGLGYLFFKFVQDNGVSAPDDTIDEDTGIQPLPSEPTHRLIAQKTVGSDVIYRVETQTYDLNGDLTYTDEPEQYIIGNSAKTSFVTGSGGNVSFEIVNGEDRIDALVFYSIENAEAFLEPEPEDDPDAPQAQPEEDGEEELPPIPVQPQLPSFGDNVGLPTFGGF